ncbi:hypothetical protein AB0J35_05065 [Nonomuraea angiospora]|uniref:hypothetical protein n=1 Tax=Nonomuraea angiospora TaxID=46172 RepID=UPI00341EB58A
MARTVLRGPRCSNAPGLPGERRAYTGRTVRRHLAILEKHGLATEGHRPAGWRRTRASLTDAARRIDAHGTRERRHRAYALDRQLYAWWLAEFDWMKTRGKRTARGRTMPGQGRLILPGAPSYANRARYPRDHRGRADHRAARVHLQLAAAARRAPQPGGQAWGSR